MKARKHQRGKNSLLSVYWLLSRGKRKVKQMNKLLKTAALAGTLGLAVAAFSTQASAWWGGGPWGGGPWNGLGNGFGDGNFSMNFSGRGNAYNRGYGYGGYPGYGYGGYPGGWGGYPGYGYGGYPGAWGGAPYGYPPVAPPAPPAPAAPKK